MLQSCAAHTTELQMASLTSETDSAWLVLTYGGCISSIGVMDAKNVTYLELQKPEPNPHLLPREAFYNCYSKNMSSMSWSRELFSISILNMWQSDEGSFLYFMYFILVSTNFYKFCGHCVSYNRNTFTRTLPLYITMFFSFSITVCNCNWCKCVLSSQQKEKRKGALKSNKVLYTTPYFGARKLTTK